MHCSACFAQVCYTPWSWYYTTTIQRVPKKGHFLLPLSKIYSFSLMQIRSSPTAIHSLTSDRGSRLYKRTENGARGCFPDANHRPHATDCFLFLSAFAPILCDYDWQ